MKQKVLTIIRIILGVIFLISSFAKATDTHYFENVIDSYGFANLYLIAPFIIVAEFLIGLFLVLKMWTKLTALISLCLVACFTVVYSYGLIAMDVTDCGCFGPNLFFLTSSPVFLYVRNLLMIAGLAYLFANTDYDDTKLVNYQVYLVSCGLIAVLAFFTGNSFKWSMKKNMVQKFEAVHIKDHPLGKLVDVSPDSTYLVTLFSFSCPHCVNSIANMEQFEESGAVDHVKGIAIEDSVKEAEFREFFTPSFQITTKPGREVNSVSVKLPISYIIKEDSIVGILPGQVPSAFILKDFLSKGKNDPIEESED